MEIGPKRPVTETELVSVLSLGDAVTREEALVAVPVWGDAYRGVVAGQDFVVVVDGTAQNVWSFTGHVFKGVRRVVLGGGTGNERVIVNGRDVLLTILSPGAGETRHP